MIAIITKRLHNVTSIDLNKLIIENVVTNPVLMLNELEIKSMFYYSNNLYIYIYGYENKLFFTLNEDEFCMEFKSEINDMADLYLDNKTCLQCLFNSNGTQFKYCNKTITLINTPE
jgi:hypothetical protein